MSQEAEFINGLIVKAPNENAPEYVKAKLSIRNAEMIAFLQGRLDRGEEWTNGDVNVSQGGKWYAKVDNWKPNTGNTSTSGPRGGAPQRERVQPATAGFDDGFQDSEIPF